jgi:hypothetical protein
VRWRKAGVWDRILTAVTKGMQMIDMHDQTPPRAAGAFESQLAARGNLLIVHRLIIQRSHVVAFYDAKRP